LNWFKENSY